MEVNASERLQDAPASDLAPADTVETEGIFPMAFERDLFGDVDMITMCDEEQLSGSTSKESRAREIIEELHKKQLKLERRSEFLLRRLRKLQARAMGQHVSGEVVGLLECIHRTLRRVKETSVVENPEGNEPEVKIEEPITPVSSNTLKNLVKKLEVSSMIQSNVSSKQRGSLRYFGSGSVEHGSSRSSGSGSVVVPKLGQQRRLELDRVTGLLKTELKVVENQVDSDATASSSGGESCDEMQTYNNPHQQFLAT